MRSRRLLAGPRTGKAICVALLVLSVLVCGLHIAGADLTHTGGATAAEMLAFLALSFLVCVLAGLRSGLQPALSGPPGRLLGSVGTRRGTWPPRLVAPLRC